MVSKYSAFLLLIVLSTTYSLPLSEEPKEDRSDTSKGVLVSFDGSAKEVILAPIAPAVQPPAEPAKGVLETFAESAKEVITAPVNAMAALAESAKEVLAPAPAEPVKEPVGSNAENEENAEDEKLLIPLIQFTAAMRPPAPGPAPPPPAVQTLLVPQGTQVSVSSSQPVTVHQQPHTLISASAQQGGPVHISTGK